MDLQARTFRSRGNTRLRYVGIVLMKVDGAITEKRIGFIDSWFITKPCAAYPNIASGPWVKQWLQPSLRTYRTDDDEVLASVLRVLYHVNGQPRQGKRTKQASELGDEGNAIVFIQNVEIDWSLPETRSVSESYWISPERSDE